MNENKNICPHCGRAFTVDIYDAHRYRGQFICFDCFDRDFGYCNGCGELFRYSEMNDDILCADCAAKEDAQQ